MYLGTNQRRIWTRTGGLPIKETLPLIAAAGIEPLEDISKSRKLIFDTTDSRVKLIIIRATDVPTYVQYGGADMGITGKDVLMEHGAEGLYEPLDLKISECRLMTAAKTDAKPVKGRLKVATKFVSLAKQYYARQGIQADIIKLYGAMELAPIMDLADMIVDIVDTGNTLRANGMEPLEEIAEISSRLIVNKAAMRSRFATISRVIDELTEAVQSS